MLGLVILLFDASGKRALDPIAGVQRAEYDDRFDRFQRQGRRYIVGDARQAQHLYLQPLAARARSFQILARIVVNSEHQRAPAHRLPQCLGVRCDLIAYRGADQIGPVRVKTFAHQKIDMSEIDVAEIDRDLFGIRLPCRFASICHLCTIHTDGED